MHFNEYQNRTKDTAIYPQEGNQGIIYCALGLAGEAGEVAGKVKKVLRDNCGVFTPEKKEEIADEIGDVLWYCSQLAKELGKSLETIAYDNLRKLRDRKERDALKGDGDKR